MLGSLHNIMHVTYITIYSGSILHEFLIIKGCAIIQCYMVIL